MTLARHIVQLRGPIAVFGAGGFIGVNLLQTLLQHRSDVVGYSQAPARSWRLRQAKVPTTHLAKVDLLRPTQLARTLARHRPQTVFNLAAYGAYAKQKDIAKIHATNFLSTVSCLELLKRRGFAVYLHAGSQSEYGLNAAGPREDAELVPNSHYAVSKTAAYYLMKYYGKVERLPVAHVRLYSVYGPWEEPDRLIPTLIRTAKQKKLPRFVAADISRDFIYVDDVVAAPIAVAATLQRKNYGEAFNIATGTKTTMRELASLTKELFSIRQEPAFGTMRNRGWDIRDWYGNPAKLQRATGWKAVTTFTQGLRRCYDHAGRA